MQDKEMAAWVADAAADRKAEDVVVIDVRNRCSYADFLVVATGTSQRHVQAIAESTYGLAHAQKLTCLGREGLSQGEWALVDFGSVVLHVFHHLIRSEVNLEALWQDAPRQALAAGQPAAVALAAT